MSTANITIENKDNVIKIGAVTAERAKELLKDIFDARTSTSEAKVKEASAKNSLVDMYDKLATVADVDAGDKGYMFDIGVEGKFAKILKKKTPGAPASKVLDVAKLIQEDPKLYKKLMEKFSTVVPATEDSFSYDIRMVTKDGVGAKNAPKVEGAEKKKRRTAA